LKTVDPVATGVALDSTVAKMSSNFEVGVPVQSELDAALRISA
jgi:hypothetical protein